jgi:hypothetical protein
MAFIPEKQDEWTSSNRQGAKSNRVEEEVKI